jgi:tRNA threonylcarbamoyladenosine biosynthesis protein TsaE
VTVVEWGAGLVERLNDEYLEVSIDRPEAEGVEDETRVIELLAHGGDWASRLHRLETT